MGHSSPMFPVSTLFLSFSFSLSLVFSPAFSLFFFFFLSGLSLFSSVTPIAPANLFVPLLAPLVSLIVDADFLGLPLLLISLFKLFTDLSFLTAVKIILRPFLSVGPPLLKGGLSMTTERNEAS